MDFNFMKFVQSRNRSLKSVFTVYLNWDLKDNMIH